MLLKILTLFFICAGLCDAIVYDRFSGKVATRQQMAKYKKIGATSTCTKDIKPCDATEHRRVDGSCNSMNHPMKGTFFEPLRRLLPAMYSNVSDPRKAFDGTDLGLPRVIRNILLCEGKSTNLHFTQAIPGYGIFTFGDIGSIHDINFFLKNVTDCCTAKGMENPQCTPNIIPEDDPVHRFSGIRCMNLTKPLTYADFGCTDKPEPYPIEEATGVYDLSPLYNAADKGDAVVRSYQGGQLITDVDENGIIWPPTGAGYCPANQPGETRCFGNYPNTLLSVMLLSVWYMRQHNYFAKELAAVNPCWDDETLFQTARDINIAWHSQVNYYEWLPALTGKEKLIADGILSSHCGFRDIYDESSYPEISLEFTYILRWFHVLQEGSAFAYDVDGTFLREYPYNNFTMRTGYLGIDNNIIYFTQHMYRQPCAKYHRGIHPDLAQNGLPYIQDTVDIPTSDLHKSRLLGFSPYIDYVHHCTGHKIRHFDDLEQHMDKETVYLMKQAYKHPWDIELLAGVWAEKPVEGGSVPATLSCIMNEHFKHSIKTDRHWYERPNRPHAFTLEQLLEVRKASLARLMCNVGDMVTEVQPNAFRTISADNPLTPCSEIPNIDFTKWADSCSSSCSSDDWTTADDSKTADDSTTDNDWTTADDSTTADDWTSADDSTTADDFTNADYSTTAYESATAHEAASSSSSSASSSSSSSYSNHNSGDSTRTNKRAHRLNRQY